MWISKKKWNDLEKRIVALEKKIQGQQQLDVSINVPEGYSNDMIVKYCHERMLRDARI